MSDLQEYWLYFRQFVPYYGVAFCTLAHFVYTEMTWMPRMDKPFRLDDRAISRTYVENELVSGGMCILLTVLIPMTLCLAYCTSSETDWRKSNLSRKFRRSMLIESNTHRFHCAMVMLWVSVGVTGMLTNVLKFKISNFRPDFIARCQPRDGLIIDAAEPLAYVADACTQSDTRFLVEGMKSTPSGHSSMVACGCCFAWKWIYNHVTRPTQPSTNKASRMLFRIVERTDLRTVWLPLLTAAVMASRLFDHRHHWYDVLTGCLLGLTCVHAVYFHWSKRTAHQPAGELTSDLPT
ncbi:unnamed protein product [Kluyveromyces dobzhanskii CBS 2104]|uniref:WGS project CCBQ000000000 data, contig MAT n=1 Tax=Kluyveromyces dobzhanskii CBS 2104 TaxID=1427455 RepID=A0A0A8L3S0_9SACH|nr:unnamed protein product [Kluyveromyces dobzhanskii CBS 2104]